MRNYYFKSAIGAVIMLAFAGLAGCQHKAEQIENVEVIKLYDRTCALASAYIDSIKAAKDTTQINLLLERFEARIDELNFDVEPDTDYDLTEGQNDTIAMLLNQLTATRIARLRELGVHPEAAIDSLPPAAAEAAADK